MMNIIVLISVYYHNCTKQTMDDKIKSLMYMAIGLASSSDKARRLLEKWNVDGQLSEEEGKRIINELFHSGADAGNELKQELKKQIDEILLELQLPSKREIADLHARMDALEKRLNESAK
jgi:polyhydroxyalkanoate synthesis regulator phasin